jgi:hypothetical protein
MIRKKDFFFFAAAAVTMWVFIQSPSAQNPGTPPSGTDASATAVTVDSDRKADAAMTNQSNSPQTNADKKADAAMTIPSNSASIK